MHSRFPRREGLAVVGPRAEGARKMGVVLLCGSVCRWVESRRVATIATAIIRCYPVPF